MSVCVCVLGGGLDAEMPCGRRPAPRSRSLALTSALEIAESSFLVAGADGTLWKLAKGTAAGEWATGNIWQKAEAPEAPSPGSAPSEGGGSSSSSSSAGGWSPPTELTTQQRRKVGLRPRSQAEGGRAPGLAAGRLTARLHPSKVHSGPVTALHVLPGLLVTASKDREVKLWERPSMQLVCVSRRREAEGAAQGNLARVYKRSRSHVLLSCCGVQPACPQIKGVDGRATQGRW